MKCKKCNAEWNVSATVSSSLTECPFCKESLIEPKGKLVFDNLHDALAAIYADDKYGLDVLLGDKCHLYITDYYPGIKTLMKARVKLVSSSGAADHLRAAANSSKAEKERAILLAIQKLTDEGDGKDTATDIIYEYVSVLNWGVKKTQSAPKAKSSSAAAPKAKSSSASTPKAKPSPASTPQTKKSSAPAPKAKPSPASTPQTKKSSTPAPKAKPTSAPAPQTRPSPAPAHQTKPSPARVIPEAVAEIRNGKKNGIKFGIYEGKPILWRVLDVHRDCALLLTEDIIEIRKYDIENNSWQLSELKDYLNGTGSFYGRGFIHKVFNSEEKSLILKVVQQNIGNPWYGWPGKHPTEGWLFLLSIEDLVKAFGDSGKLKANLFVKSQLLFSSGKFSDQYDSNRIAKYKGKDWFWWLRSPGEATDDVSYVDNNGRINVSGIHVEAEVGVRPALWLYLKS